MNNKNWIKNTKDFSSASKKTMITLINSMFDSIDTEKIIEDSVALEKDTLRIKSKIFDLSNFNRIKLIAIGKVSCEAISALEKILGNRINQGISIDIKEIKCERIESFIGTHPKPSLANVEATKKIFESAKDINEKDLVLVVVSGGGSALLCSSENECNQGIMLYDSFLKSGGTIKELNLIRKHTSTLKGGGLAKLFYPATTVGLIFCDVAGGHYEEVASGPTYKDNTTKEDAEKLVEKYNLGNFNLNETPKEDVFFEKVVNIPMVSNITALQGVVEKAKELNLSAEIISSEIFNSAETTTEKFLNTPKKTDVIVGGGEITVEIDDNKGSGGRSLYLAMHMLPKLKEGQVFASVASDGMDNSDAAGVIIDINTIKKAKGLNLNVEEYIKNSDSYNFFKKTNDIIFTGPTGANVADIIILLNSK